MKLSTTTSLAHWNGSLRMTVDFHKLNQVKIPLQLQWQLCILVWAQIYGQWPLVQQMYSLYSYQKGNQNSPFLRVNEFIIPGS